MKRYYLIVLFIVLSPFTVMAQFGEFQYFVIKASMLHNPYNPQPATSGGRYLVTGNAQVRMEPAPYDIGSFYIPYAIGYNVDLQFHFDFRNDKQGFILGAEHAVYPQVARYSTVTDTTVMTERLDVYSVGIPILFKFSRRGMFENQQYFFVGGQYNFNIELRHMQILAGNDDKRTNYDFGGVGGALAKNSVIAIIGFNYNFYHVQLDYLHSSPIDADYTPEGEVYPFANRPKHQVFLKTGVTIPLNTWTTSKSWILHKFTRKWGR